jgi:hypothetical protein
MSTLEEELLRLQVIEQLQIGLSTVLNDTNFKLRNAFERWQNGINNMTDNEGLTNPVDYQVDAFVDHLDRNGNTIKSYTLRGCIPK